jgi:hypothetical protein
MLNQAEKSYYFALQALRAREYDRALNYFHAAGDFFRDNREFNILRETTGLLVTVKREIAAAEGRERPAVSEDDSVLVGEVFDDSDL